MFQDTGKKLKRATPGMDWVSGCPGPLLAIFGATLSIWLSINSFGKIRKHVKRLFLYRDRFWQQVLWSEVRSAYSRPFASTSRPFGEPLDSHPTNTKTMHMRLLYNPKWLRKKQHLSTSPSNNVIACYRFK